MDSNKVVTRFAPSPTGFMHIGSVRTALFAYLWAQKNEGFFILRIEDTDKAREVEGSVEHIKNSLTWLGISWDFGPDKLGDFGSCIQSERLDIYKKYAEKLIEKDLAYPDPYTAEEIGKQREQAQTEKRPYLYREHRPESFDVWDGTKPLRLKVPEVKRYTWTDAVRGEMKAGEEMLDDIIIIKSDGYPTYNFAHIVDDIEMGVTHVMRGDEFISSMPKFLSIYDALEAAYPVFVSLPPILNDTGTKKLSKRDGAKDLFSYRDEGYLPTTMTNFLALIGWNPGTEQELFSMEELKREFTLTGIQKSGGAFNEKKLLWMNKEYYKKMSDKDFFVLSKNALPVETASLPQYSDERLGRLVPSIKERVANSIEITQAAEAGEYSYAFSVPDVSKELLKWKKDTDIADALPRLKRVLELLTEADFSSPEAIKTALWDYAEEVGKGEVLWPTRVALTGRQQSPDPFTVAHILGKKETLQRIISACQQLEIS